MTSLGKLAMALSIVATTATSVSVPAEAATRRHHYHSRTHYTYKVCRRSNGGTGLIAGGVGGALVGRSIIGHGLLGTAAGAVGGAVAGRAIDRSLTAHRRCHWVRR
jgi:outer membrane lipoprotein SlyB